MAARTETSSPAREGHEKLLPAIRTPDSGKAMLKITALQELFDRRVDGRAPESIALLITLLIDRLEPRIKLLDQLVKRCLLGFQELPQLVLLVQVVRRCRSNWRKRWSFTGNGVRMDGGCCHKLCHDDSNVVGAINADEH